jgi:signal transduction histidine kinase
LEFRLRHLLTLAFTIVAALPVVALAIWVERTALAREFSAGKEQSLIIARNLTEALERYSDDLRAVFHHVVELADQRDVTGNSPKLAAALGFRQIFRVTPSGHISWSIGQPGEADRVIGDNTLAKLSRLADRHHDIQFSTVMADDMDRPTIYLIQQFANGDVAIGALNTDHIVAVQKSVAFGKHGHAVIVDHRGNVIAHPNRAWEQDMRNLAALEPVHRVINREAGVTRFFSPAADKEMLAGFTPVSGPGWGVLVPQPVEEVAERASTVKSIATAIALAGIGGAAIISYLLSGLLLRPIDATVRAARRIASGALTARVPPPPRFSTREFRALASDFNEMARRIEAGQTSLSSALYQIQSADRAKSQFLANMSHELRTPLNAIMGFSETIESQLFGPVENEQYRQYASDIRQSGAHLLSIINTILDLSKIEAETMDLEEEEVRLQAVVEEAMSLLRAQIEISKVTAVVDLPGHLPLLRGSNVKIRQIVINLLSNAIKFTPAGGKVTVTALQENDGGITLQIEDTGIGMSQADMETALEPFGQVEGHLARKHDGIGLGLPLARQLTLLHGGVFEIRSAVDEGTTVILRLPAERVISEAA